MVKVLKFGGSSHADAEQIKKVAAIIKAEPERRYVVASAPGKRYSEDIKVTDMLYDCYKLVKANQPIDDAFALIEDRYNGIIKDFGVKLWLQPEFDRIKNAIVHHAGRDYIASRGEYLNSMVLASYLGYDFIDAEDGIFFKENGTLDTEKTNEELTAILAKHEHAVIPGFYGVMPNGTINTFSRGWSDITGSIVSRAIKADIYENWTDVSGMLMADPRCVENPKVIVFKNLKNSSAEANLCIHHIFFNSDNRETFFTCNACNNCIDLVAFNGRNNHCTCIFGSICISDVNRDTHFANGENCILVHNSCTHI